MIPDPAVPGRQPPASSPAWTARRASRLSPWLSWLAVLSPVVLLFGAVWRLGVNTLVADEFYYVDFVQLVLEHRPWLGWLWLQHNEHRVVPMKLVLALLAPATHWNQHVEMFFSAGLVGLLVLALFWAYRASSGGDKPSDLVVFAPVAWLACSLAQYENLLLGMMMCHFFTALGAVMALCLLARSGSASLLLSVAAALLGAFSIVNGFAVFPAGLVVLAGQRAGWRRSLAWGTGGLVASALYLYRYTTPSHTPDLRWSIWVPLRAAKFCFEVIGSPFAAGSQAWALAFGFGLSGLAAICLSRWVLATASARARQAVAVGLLLFGLGSCAMIAGGRAAMSATVSSIGSRYTTYAALAWIGAYFLVLDQSPRRRADPTRVAAWSFLLLALLAANLHGLTQARASHRDRLLDQYALQTFAQQSDAVLARLGPPADVRRVALYLEAAKLSAFAEPQRLLLVLDPSTGRTLDEIAPGRSVEQRLLCPVPELRDVGVRVSPADRPGTGSFTVTIATGDRELARREFANLSVRQSAWVRVTLPAPYSPCAGRELAVRVESRATRPGEGISAVAAESYYDGVLLQGLSPLADRRLALALNAFDLGVLDPRRVAVVDAVR